MANKRFEMYEYRHIFVRMRLGDSDRARAKLACHRHAFEWFKGVVTKVTIDYAKCAITRACFRDHEVQRAYGEYAEGYG